VAINSLYSLATEMRGSARMRVRGLETTCRGLESSGLGNRGSEIFVFVIFLCEIHIQIEDDSLNSRECIVI
jgi:hypothetical protein